MHFGAIPQRHEHLEKVPLGYVLKVHEYGTEAQRLSVRAERVRAVPAGVSER